MSAQLQLFIDTIGFPIILNYWSRGSLIWLDNDSQLGCWLALSIWLVKGCGLVPCNVTALFKYWLKKKKLCQPNICCNFYKLYHERVHIIIILKVYSHNLPLHLYPRSADSTLLVIVNTSTCKSTVLYRLTPQVVQQVWHNVCSLEIIC